MRIKGWNKFQHFRDRTPPWVKLYRDLLDDPDWHDLDGDSAKTLIMLWLIASEDETHIGTLPDIRKLAFRLRIDKKKLEHQIAKLSHWLIQDDITMISGRYQVDAPEGEGEREREGEERQNNVEKESRLHENIPYKEIVDYLNKKAHTHFRHTTVETKRHIKARWNQGFDVSAFKHVIDVKSSQWLTDEKMVAYLRPQTLFGTKFESYLNEAIYE
jgi:uncharacterized phage protein (TIGR02220 family)